MTRYYDSTENLSKMIFADFSNVITKMYAKTEVTDIYKKELLLHQNYAGRMSRFFSGRGSVCELLGCVGWLRWLFGCVGWLRCLVGWLRWLIRWFG